MIIYVGKEKSNLKIAKNSSDKGQEGIKHHLHLLNLDFALKGECGRENMHLVGLSEP